MVHNSLYADAPVTKDDERLRRRVAGSAEMAPLPPDGQFVSSTSDFLGLHHEIFDDPGLHVSLTFVRSTAGPDYGMSLHETTVTSPANPRPMVSWLSLGFRRQGDDWKSVSDQGTDTSPWTSRAARG